MRSLEGKCFILKPLITLVVTKDKALTLSELVRGPWVHLRYSHRNSLIDSRALPYT